MELPYGFDLVIAALMERREALAATPGGAPEHALVVPTDLAEALKANAVFRHKVAAHDLVIYALRAHADVLVEVTEEQLKHGDIMAMTSLLPLSAAETIATSFFEFASKHRLSAALATMSSQQIQILALFHSHLLQRPVKRVGISERLDLILPRRPYVPASAVVSPAVPHFARVACDYEAEESGGALEHSVERSAVIQAPVICQLCGTGFLSHEDLWQHAADAHHSWAEYRKRLIWEVQQRPSVPLQPIEKRRLAGNFMQDMLHSYPARNTLRPGQCTARQVVACAVCAYKDSYLRRPWAARMLRVRWDASIPRFGMLRGNGVGC